MVNEDMPYFHQFPNACGLTSLLMALKPASRNIDEILNYGWDKVKLLFQANPKETQEFHWQRVLEYLLTACTQHPAVRAYLENTYPEFCESVCPWLEFALLGEKALNASTAHPNLLRASHLIMNRVRTMKHDVELKLLAFLFGCRFFSWKKGTDGTGAAFFSQEDLVEKRKGREGEEVEEKLTFIKKGLDDGGPVLWGASFHWLAARELHAEDGREVLFYHDPMGGGDHSIGVAAFHETDRFYVFSFDTKLLEEHVSIIKQAFDIPAPLPEIIPKEAPIEKKPPTPPPPLEKGVEAGEEEEAEEKEEETSGVEEISEEELLKIEAFAKKIKELQLKIAEKDKQLATLKRKLAGKELEIKQLKKKLEKSPN